MGTVSTMKTLDDANRLYGSFADQSFPELLVHLRKAGKTGILYTVSDRVKKKIYIQDGVPTAARSNIKSELLGEMLVAKGIISREQQEMALAAQKEEEGRQSSFGALLVQEGVISADDLFVQARRQFLTVLFSLFGVLQGHYKFQEGELPSNGYYYEVSFSNMLVFGMRQIASLDALEEMVGDRSQIPAPSPQFLDYSKIMFTVKELSVINELDGSKSMDEIVNASDVEPSTVFKTLLILMHHDFIHFKIEVPDDEGEEIVEVDASAKGSLGLYAYDPADASEEQAVAGSDFKVSPEGIHPTHADPSEAAPAERGDAPQREGTGETALPETVGPMVQEAGVIDLNSENLDAVLSTFHGGTPAAAHDRPDSDDLSSEDEPEAKILSESGTLSLEATLDRDAGAVSGPVASAFRLQGPEEQDGGNRAALSEEKEEPLPPFEQEDFSDRFLGDADHQWSGSSLGGKEGTESGPSMAEAIEETPSVELASVVAPPVPAQDAGDACDGELAAAVQPEAPSTDVPGTPMVTDSEDEELHDEAPGGEEVVEPSPFLSDTVPESHADDVPAGEQTGASASVRQMLAASQRTAPVKKKRSLVFAVLLFLAVGLGVFSWTPWRAEFQDRLLARFDRTDAAVPPPVAAPAVEIPRTPTAPVAEELMSDGEESAAPSDAEPIEATGQPDAAVLVEGATAEETHDAIGSPEATTAVDELPDTGSTPQDAELQGVPSENPALAAATALYPVEDWWARMKAWTDRVRGLPRSKFTIQVQISENLDFVWEDLNQLLPEHDAMVLRYRIKDWSAYTLIVGIYDSRAQGMDALQNLPPEILRLGPLVKTMATIQKGLVEPVAKP